MSKYLNVEWKTQECFSGPECWCAVIVPVEKIIDEDENEWDCVVPAAAVSKVVAEHIVNLHNFYIKNKEGYTNLED